jgi:hypothetical protein
MRLVCTACADTSWTLPVYIDTQYVTLLPKSQTFSIIFMIESCFNFSVLSVANVFFHFQSFVIFMVLPDRIFIAKLKSNSGKSSPCFRQF